VSAPRAAALGPAAAWLAAAALAACSGAPASAPRPDVVWISIDTLRADRLSCYGHGRATSPNIDRLAAEGVLFERALSTTSWTLPAHLSMLTGLPVSSHGVCVPEYPGAAPLRGTFVSETLRAAGYATGGFYAHGFLERLFADKGWDVWERTGRVHRESLAIRADWEAAQAAGDKELARELKRRHQAMFEEGAPEADDAVDRALDWLERTRAADPERPFFLFLHLFDVHTPYKPPAAFDFDPDYAGPLEEVNVDHPSRPVRPGMDPRDLEHVRALYDGEIAWVDSQVGRLLGALEEAGLARSALVILTADHGDEFLEHGGSGHHHTLYQELLHVPLIARWPAALPAGRRVAERVSIIDIAPTLLAALGLEHPGPLPGIDLFALARGTESPQGRVILSELRRLQGRPEEWLVSLVRGEEQFIVTRPGSDRAELARVDLARGLGAAPEPLAWESDAGRFVAEELERQRAELLRLRASSADRGGALSAQSELESDELEALGYLEIDTAGEREGERLCLDGCLWPER
jgi:arylsulfatase A-like enzyme